MTPTVTLKKSRKRKTLNPSKVMLLTLLDRVIAITYCDFSICSVSSPTNDLMFFGFELCSMYTFPYAIINSEKKTL